ncbi:prepilin peptidase [Ilumatobacter sp.]|uniref:prepilin peptidase n=1 Tax=Ilumatobacter sp. TaxID=1967498 RepID=UPI003B5182DD
MADVHSTGAGGRPRATNFTRAHAALVAIVATVLVLTSSTAGVVATLRVALVGLALVAAVVDLRTGRIPDALNATCATCVVAAIPAVAASHRSALGETAVDAVAGAALGGAPVALALWIIRPDALGGGDWKLLGCVGAGLGLVAPVTALVMIAVAAAAHVAGSLVGGRGPAPFAPGVAVGTIAAVATSPYVPSHSAGWPS